MPQLSQLPKDNSALDAVHKTFGKIRISSQLTRQSLLESGKKLSQFKDLSLNAGESTAQSLANITAAIQSSGAAMRNSINDAGYAVQNIQSGTTQQLSLSIQQLSDFGDLLSDFQLQNLLNAEERLSASSERLFMSQQRMSERTANSQRQLNNQMAVDNKAHYDQMGVTIKNAHNLWATSMAGYLSANASAYKTYNSKLVSSSKTTNKKLSAQLKLSSVAQSIMNAYTAANKTMAAYPAPLAQVMSAIVLAKALDNVSKIQSVAAAHGGLTNVPHEETYLLQRGERVLSPNQNRDLTQFMSSSPRSGGARIDTVNIHVLENVDNADSLLEIEPDRLRVLVAEKIVPALNALQTMGLYNPQETRTN